MSILRFVGVVREIGAFTILDRIDASMAYGDGIGLVGPNGAGKTTLLRLAAGVDDPDRGHVQRKRGLSIGLLSQEAHFDTALMAEHDLRTAVRSGAVVLEHLELELAALERAHRVTEPAYEELQQRFETLGGYTLDQRVDEALSGLGFARVDWGRPPSSLSGGEQTRAALARLLIADPDLLLLDEPTNHLDLDALEWTEEHVRRRHGSLLVASHDRAFLDATVTRIWELRDRGLTTFRGNYSAYHRQRIERDERAAKEGSSHAQQIARERELVQRYRSHRKYSKMHEHEARLARLEAEQVTTPRRGRTLNLPTTALAGSGPSRSGTTVVEMEDLVVGYSAAAVAPGDAIGEPVAVARAPWLAAQRGERIGIVGPNGAGKTTLLRTIAGDLPVLDGRLVLGSGVQIGYLAQLREAGIPGATVLEALTGALPITAGEARSYLSRFLFRGDDVLKEVRTLSGGERSRLELALLGILPSNLLLLDEPTNHLDIPAREALETFLRESPAMVLVVSHDRRLLETLCDRLWVVDAGLVAPFDGGYRAWRAAIGEGWTVVAAVEAESRRLRTSGARTAGGTAAGVAGGTAAGAAGHIPAGGTVDGLAAGPAGSTAAGPAAGPASGAYAAAGVSTGRAGGRSVRTSARRPATAEAGPRTSAAAPANPRKRDRLSKDSYRRQKASIEADLTRLGLRKAHLELALSDPATMANFVELRRIASELADVGQALHTAEVTWLELEERAP